MTWIVAYDVSQNRRRQRVSKSLVKEGIRIQKSVFLVEGSAGQVRKLVTSLGKEIDWETDSVCAWSLAQHWSNRQVAQPHDATLTREIFVIG